MPPLWTSAYVASLARGELFRNLDGSLAIAKEPSMLSPTNGSPGADSAEARPDSPWEACFAQPASDYLAFRNKLDANSVSLENVIVREAEHCLIGTVKVKNLAYDKRVSIRCTSDNWASHQDVPCEFVEQPGLAGHAAVRNLYDTFRFRLALPEGPGARQLEFCVRYTTEGAEFWDNNAGANYLVQKKRDVSSADDPRPTSPSRSP